MHTDNRAVSVCFGADDFVNNDFLLFISFDNKKGRQLRSYAYLENSGNHDTVVRWLLKIFRGITNFNAHYTNKMPEFFATNLHFPAAIEFALVSLYVVASPFLEPAIPCIT